MKIYCKSLFFLAIFLLSSAAGAATLSGEYSISYYQDAPVERTFVLQNDSTAREFSLDITGEKVPWAYVTPTKETIKGFCASSQDIVLCTAPSDFSLAAGAQREIYFFSKAKTYAKPGNYSVDVLANATRLGTFDITVQQGHTVSIESANAEQTAGQCEAKTFELGISNTGRFDEEIALSVSGIPGEWSSVSDQSFILNRGASQTAQVTIQAPCGQELKTYNFTATATIPRANSSATEQLSYTIQNKQGISLSDIDNTGSGIDACKETETRKTIKITNNGRLPDEIELSIKAPDWASISANKLSIEPGASKTLTITTAKTSAGEEQYTAEIFAKSTKFGNTAAKAITINLEDCYNAETEELSGPEKACIGESPEFKFSITNDRENPIALNITVSGAKATLDKKTLSLESGQEETITATIDTRGETEGKKELVLDISSNYFSTTQKTSIELVKCRLEITPEKPIVDVNTVVGTLTRIVVSNKTLTTENIKVAVQGKDWILFNPKEFLLNPEEKKEVFMYISPPFNTENELQEASITARSNKHVASKTIDLNITGGVQIGKADVIVKSVEIKEIGSVKQVKTTVSLKNDSNVSITVSDINSDAYDIKYSMRNHDIKPNQSNPVELTILLPKGFFDDNRFSVPLTINTEQGSFNRVIVLDLSPAKTTDQNAAEQTIPIGMAFFSQPKNILLTAAIIALIALVAYLALTKNGEKKEEDEESMESGDEKSRAYSIVKEVKGKARKKTKKKKR